MARGIIKAEEMLHQWGLVWQWCCPDCSSMLWLKTRGGRDLKALKLEHDHKCTQFGTCKSNNPQTEIKNWRLNPPLCFCGSQQASILLSSLRKTLKTCWSDVENDLLFYWDSTKDCVSQCLLKSKMIPQALRWPVYTAHSYPYISILYARKRSL